MNKLIFRCALLLFVASFYSCEFKGVAEHIIYPSDTLNGTDADKNLSSGPGIDSLDYQKRLLNLAHDSADHIWPVRDSFTKTGAILPYNRILAYYGNFYSASMGVLGQYDIPVLKQMLKNEVEAWSVADTSTTVLPAIHYIAVTAQRNPGASRKHRLRMPFHQIDKAVSLARDINGIAFLDIQVGHSTLMEEVPELEKYLVQSDIHLGIDPEWSMKDGAIPGKKVGTIDASDINWVIDYLASIVKQNNLPPKVLIVHRFTNGMVTNSHKIKKCPEVQIVMNMDGFGFPAKKKDTYKRFIAGQPVQYTGFKLFYKNDKADKPYRLMTPEEVLGLRPRPVYIQYQ